MFFKEDFIDALKDDPINSTIKLVNIVEDEMSKSLDWDTRQHELLDEAYALVLEILDAGILPIVLNEIPSDLAGGSGDYSVIWNFLQNVQEVCRTKKAKTRVSSLRSHFRARLGTGFVYEFSQGDLDRVQQLINELRERISKTNALKPEHQQRLLRRLEELQAEMHKKVSDLDRFWGLVGDAGVIFGKLGNDAKPIVDRIKEIANIVWRTQSRAEELPSGAPLPSLEHKPHESVEEV